MTAALTTLVSFNGANGESPEGSLIADSNGDLFGTTEGNTVFELVNNGTVAAPSYASTPTTLVSFNGANGAYPVRSLIADANGDLFGPTAQGGVNNDGTVFEPVNHGTVAVPSYASTPTTLVSFNKSNGVLPEGSLIADVNGDLFGTTRVSLVHGSSGCSVDRTVWTLGGSGSRRAAFSPENPALLQLALPLISSPSR
jgi:hypothetical protein